MIELSNTIAQTVQPGQSITFDTVVLHTGNGECHRPGTSSVKMKANGVYEINFSANIGSSTATTTVQLAMALGGEVLAESVMKATSVAANDLNNVAKTIPVKNCCCDYDRITITNNGTTAVTVDAGPSLFVKRVS